VNRYADVVFVTSEPDIKRFITEKRGSSKIFAIRGGVDIKEATEYLNSNNVIPVSKRKYDACFVGRFHQQKGVLVLVDIWKRVVDKRPDACLAMIGNGPLEKKVLDKTRELGVEKNINLFGFLDGEKKFEIFKQSKIVVHPATFDSGGMAAAGAMAWGLPAVGFDLESLRTYYPCGMVKVPLANVGEFAQEILRLLEDPGHYEKMASEARRLAIEEWVWEKRAGLVWNILT
jgi:glycosyltransferase involved in cell wall biosynthesis